MEISGGAKLEKYLADLGKKLGSGASVDVGFLDGATYPDGTSVPMVAAINEYGKEGQPPRPYFRNMVAAKSESWPDAMAQNLKATDYDVAKTMGRMGEGIRGQLQQSITDLTDPPLKAATIRRKGFAKPLIDTGHMLNSADYRVNE